MEWRGGPGVRLRRRPTDMTLADTHENVLKLGDGLLGALPCWLNHLLAVGEDLFLLVRGRATRGDQGAHQHACFALRYPGERKREGHETNRVLDVPFVGSLLCDEAIDDGLLLLSLGLVALVFVRQSVGRRETHQ